MHFQVAFSNRFKFKPYVVGLRSGFKHGVRVKLMLLLQCYLCLLEHQMAAAATATALHVEAQEDCGKGFQITTLRQKNELSKELFEFGTGLV